MTRKTKGRSLKKWQSSGAASNEGELRIIGGTLRGRKIRYSGDPRTRPMMDTTREALFNLVGAWIENKIAIDLFAGTGAVGFEALSRGASRAMMVERHIPTTTLIHQNAQSLDVSEHVTVAQGDAFFWIREFLEKKEYDSTPWVVFFCPPYALFVDDKDRMLKAINDLFQSAPEGSVFAIESDIRFGVKQLPDAEHWKTRQYSPAQISVWRGEHLGHNES